MSHEGLFHCFLLVYYAKDILCHLRTISKLHIWAKTSLKSHIKCYRIQHIGKIFQKSECYMYVDIKNKTSNFLMETGPLSCFKKSYLSVSYSQKQRMSKQRSPDALIDQGFMISQHFSFFQNVHCFQQQEIRAVFNMRFARAKR